jgi:hypothetical protein
MLIVATRLNLWWRIRRVAHAPWETMAFSQQRSASIFELSGYGQFGRECY